METDGAAVSRSVLSTLDELEHEEATLQARSEQLHGVQKRLQRATTHATLAVAQLRARVALERAAAKRSRAEAQLVRTAVRACDDCDDDEHEDDDGELGADDEDDNGSNSSSKRDGEQHAGRVEPAEAKRARATGCVDEHASKRVAGVLRRLASHADRFRGVVAHWTSLCARAASVRAHLRAYGRGRGCDGAGDLRILAHAPDGGLVTRHAPTWDHARRCIVRLASAALAVNRAGHELQALRQRILAAQRDGASDGDGDDTVEAAATLRARMQVEDTRSSYAVRAHRLASRYAAADATTAMICEEARSTRMAIDDAHARQVADDAAAVELERMAAATDERLAAARRELRKRVRFLSAM